MFSDMFAAMDEGRAPQETFYDGYVVNAIMDAAYRSAKARRLGSRSSSTGAAATTPRIASTPETFDGPGRHQARDPARRPPQAHPQGPGLGRLQRPGGLGRIAGPSSVSSAQPDDVPRARREPDGQPLPVERGAARRVRHDPVRIGRGVAGREVGVRSGPTAPRRPGGRSRAARRRARSPGRPG